MLDHIPFITGLTANNPLQFVSLHVFYVRFLVILERFSLQTSFHTMHAIVFYQ